MAGGHSRCGERAFLGGGEGTGDSWVREGVGSAVAVHTISYSPTLTGLYGLLRFEPAKSLAQIEVAP